MTRFLPVVLLFATLSVFSSGQDKRPLAIDDFESWNSLSNTMISNDGSRIAFVQNTLKGDGMLIVKSVKSGYDTIPRGYRAAFGPESDFMIFSIKQPEDSIRKAKIARVKKEDMPKDSLGIKIFSRNVEVRFPDVKSYKVPEENARWIAFTIELSEMPEDSIENGEKKKKEKQAGDNLALFNIGTGDTIMVRNVTDWFFSKNGNALFFSTEKKDSTGTFSSLFRFDTSAGKYSEIFSEKGWLKKPASDVNGSQAAFLFSQDTIKEKVYSLYAGNPETGFEKVADTDTEGIPAGWSPSEDGPVYFSEDGSRLFLGTAPKPLPEPKDTIPDDEKPNVDIWNWQDLKIQPQQKIEIEKEKKRNYTAVYNISSRQFIQIGDSVVRNLSVTGKGNGNFALGSNELPYLRESSWTGKYLRDYYITDLTTGEKYDIAEQKTNMNISPKGKFVVWYEPSDSSYYARSTDRNKTKIISLTKNIQANFYNELNDVPMEPGPYGIAGWTEDDRYVYIYDRFDIWKIDPEGETEPVNITGAFGRKNNIRFRYVKLDSELEYIPEKEKILLSAFNEVTMEGGFYDARFDKPAVPRMLIMDKNHFGDVKKAKDADKLIWTKESVAEFPDLWSSKTDFRKAERISAANPQQENFIWPYVELVEWTSFSGEKLKGLLYLPENISHERKYPMVVYFYERNSESLYRHQYPSPSRSTINKTFYASNGYIVFVPDITYKVGYPGKSAYDAIVSGTQYLINRFPFVDEKHIGLQGQSWGGYQTAYLISQTDLYAAAMAGAPVSNMTSAYGGIRWETGLSRMFQYEHTQSRIGGTLWEKPMHYIENSPLFHAPRINTPLLMMHNDNDGAVPWYQGIEMFVALRRLGKPVWMLNYNGEPHNLNAGSLANRMDLSRRMFQFFNHYLKGEPMPVWMREGIPAVEKGKNLGY